MTSRSDQKARASGSGCSNERLPSWTGSFDEKFNGVFEVQDAISERVARLLTPSLEIVADARTPPLGSNRSVWC